MTINYLDSKRISALSSDALVAHLKFNDDVTDSAGSNNGTVTGTTTYVTGKIDKAFSFNGSSYVTLANESNFDIDYNEPFSIAFWYKTDNTSNNHVYGKGNNSSPYSGIQIGIYSGKIQIDQGSAYPSSYFTKDQSTASTANVWHHAVMTLSGSGTNTGCKLYVDGSIVSMNTASPDNQSASILNNISPRIGYDGNSIYNTGLLDDVRIYSRELDQSEVTMIYNSGNGTEENKPTNVQDNSILVEKDTGRRYWRTPASDGADNITWSTTGKVGYNISGTTISRTGSAGWSLSKIQSEDTFTVGNGTFMIEFSGNGSSVNTTQLGFNKGTLGYHYGSGSPQNPCDFAIYMAGGDQLEAFVGGTKAYGSGGTRSASDKYRLEINNDGLVKYYLQAGGTGSWVLKYTSSTAASGTYFIQVNSHSASSEATVHSKYLATPATWTMNPTFEDDFSTDNWVDQDTEQQVTGGSLAYDPKRDGSNDASSYDLQNALGTGVNADDEKWVLQYVQNHTSVYSSGNGNRLWFGISDKPSSTAQNGTHQFIGLYQNFDATSQHGAVGVDGGALPQNGTATVSPATGTDYYTRISRVGSTSMRVQVFTGGYDQTVFYDETLTIASTLVGLRYIWIGNFISSHGGDSITGTIDDLKFYNGVNTPN